MNILNNDGVYEDVKLRPSNSIKFADGSFHKNRDGLLEVIGTVDKVYIDKQGNKRYRYFLVKFQDGTFTIALMPAIGGGRVKNINAPNVCNKGFIGKGKFKPSINGFKTKYD